MKRHIKLFTLSLFATMIFFATDFSNAQTVSVSNTEFGLNIDSPTLSPSYTYTVLVTFVQDGNVYVVLRNPWGTIEVVEEETYLQFLIQSENRKFQSVSNVMKTKQDTANSTINNLR